MSGPGRPSTRTSHPRIHLHALVPKASQMAVALKSRAAVRPALYRPQSVEIARQRRRNVPSVGVSSAPSAAPSASVPPLAVAPTGHGGLEADFLKGQAGQSRRRYREVDSSSSHTGPHRGLVTILSPRPTAYRLGTDDLAGPVVTSHR